MRKASDPRHDRGQGLVEFAMLVPVFLLLVLGLLEFGFIFDQAMTLNYATREGARSGAAFAAGNTTTMPCADVDKNIMAAVQRVLKAPGSRITASEVAEIRIYRSAMNGSEAGPVNVWTYAAGAGPAVDGQNLDFSPSSTGWSACIRDNDGAAVDSIGVSVRYRYNFVTPLSAIVGFFGPSGASNITISDRTVMALNPTND